MSMTLDDLIKIAFPIDGHLDKLTCGHPSLNEYKGYSLSLRHGDAFRFETPPNGSSPVYANPESAELKAAECARQEERRKQGYVVNPPPSVFDRINACTAERKAFGERLKAHLAPRLGEQLYAEFEHRIDAARTFRSSSRPLSFDDIAGFSTVAYEVMYLADAKSDIEALRARSVAAFEAAREQAPTAGENPDYRCAPCERREVSAEIRTVFGNILERAPQHYRPLLARLAGRAIADVGRAAEEAVRATSVTVVDVGQGEQQTLQGPLLPRSIGASDSESGRTVAAAASGGKSLFQRLFGCCFPNPA